jgi:hypothetical protein
MGCIVGREGSGKSYTAVKMANILDDSFNAERVIFDVTDLLKILRDGDHKPGNFYVLDEAGVSLGRRTWQERGQVLANQALQLIRSHNLGLIFTLPRLSELDSQTVGRLQAVVEITEKKNGEYVAGKWKFIDPDRVQSNGTILKKFPRRLQNGRKKRITSVSFAPPRDEELMENYENNKKEFQERVYEETIEKVEDGEGDESDSGEKSLKKVAEEIIKDDLGSVVSEHGNTGEPYVDTHLLRAEYELSRGDSRTVKSLVEKKVDLDDHGVE